MNCQREEGRKFQMKITHEQKQRDKLCADFPGQSTDYNSEEQNWLVKWNGPAGADS